MQNQEVEIDDDLLNKAKRVAAETCLDIARNNVKNGNIDEARVFYKRAERLYYENYCTSDQSNSENDSFFKNYKGQPFKDFSEFLHSSDSRNYSDDAFGVSKEEFIPGTEASVGVKIGRERGDAARSAKTRFENDGEIGSTSTGLNSEEPTGVHSNERYVKFTHIDSKSNIMETVGSFLFESEGEDKFWKSRQPAEPASLSKETNCGEEAVPCLWKETPISALKNVGAFAKNNCIDTSWHFVKAAMLSSANYVKPAYDWVKSWSFAILWKFFQILLVALCFVFLAFFAVAKIALVIIKFIFGILFGLLLICLTRLLGDNAKRPAYTSRRAKRQPYTVKKEFPMTSKEAVKHLLSCENGNNFYETLLVDECASQEDIRRNYRRLALLVHPDKLQDCNIGGEDVMKTLNAAYDVLGDEVKRGQYDQDDISLDEMFEEFMESFQSSIPCSACGGRHAITLTKRHPMHGRYCGICKDYHAVYGGEAWVESTFWMKELYLCMKDCFQRPRVYKLTTWGPCQSSLLARVPSNAHEVVLRMTKEDSEQNYSQHNTKTRRMAGKKRRSRKYKL